MRSPIAKEHMMEKIRLNPQTIDNLSLLPSEEFEWIGFDPIDDCNLHCVYCHNSRTKSLMDLSKFKDYLNNNIKSVASFQFGCVMEPTLDSRLVEFMELVANSKTSHKCPLTIHTNGTLLHRHDQDRMVAAGLNQVSVSIDTSSPDTFKRLRGGANLEKALRNLKNFREKHPDILMRFVPTVNTANVDEMDALVKFGLEIGVTHYAFREMFHYPTNSIVDHNEMLELVLPDDSFANMQQQITSKYGDAATLFFLGEQANKLNSKKISTDSALSV